MSEAGRQLPAGFFGWVNRHYIFLAALGLLLFYFSSYMAAPIGAPIRSDGAGYYAYLPSLVLYADPSFETDARVHYGGEFPHWTYVRRYPPTGRYLNALNIGVSALMLPFFLLGHGLTCWFGWPWGGPSELAMRFAPDGYSFFYQHAAGLSGLVYFLLGLSILKRLLNRQFRDGPVLAALTALLLGTNLCYYAAGDTVTAHPYTFFLAAAMIWLSRAWYEAPARRWVPAVLGVVLMLLVLVRPLNVLFWLWVPLCGLTSVAGARDRIRFYAGHPASLALMGGTAFLVLLPQLLLWKYASGHFLVKAYQHVGSSSFGAPQILDVLVGLRKGLFLWFPVFALVAAGLFRLRKRAPEYSVAVLVLGGVYLLVVSSYNIWWSAGGFGNRYVVDVVILAAFPLAAFYDGLQTARGRWVAGILTGLCVVFTLFLLTLMYRREIGFYGLDAQGWFDIFWWRKEAFLEWWRGA